MIPSKTHLPLQQIVQVLRALCEEERTGVLRIITDNNHTAQFGLEAGRIAAIRYRIKRGLDALGLVKQIRAGQCSFEEGQNAGNEAAALPSNEEIFAQLGQAAAAAPTQPSAANAAPSAEPATPVAPVAPSDAPFEFSTAAKIAFEDALAEHIGPMASIVCRNVLAQASGIGEAIEMMKAKIPDPERAEQFERNVMSRTLV